jgi:mannose-6-phosphate isomerase-like protein (cupin superfamily)
MSTTLSRHGIAATLRAELAAHIGRHTEKDWDWDAFPGNRGFPDLARAQMRYVGAGGSPKIDDASTLRPEHFTVSLIHQPPGKYAAAHSHEIEEAFLVLAGVLTVAWEAEGEVVEVRLGPKDMILNADGIAHGFRNAGVDPVLMSILVGVGKPLPPRYHAHPKDVSADLAAAFGAKPGRTHAFDPASDHPLQRRMARHVVRNRDLIPLWDEAGFARMVYVGAGGIPAANNRLELVTVPRGVRVEAYARAVEDVFFVLEGTMSVGWEEAGETVEARLGPKDLVFNPAGRRHSFRNDGVGDAQFLLAVGSKESEPVAFRRTR